MQKDNVSDLKKELNQANQRAEAAEAKAVSLEAAAATGNILAEISQLSDVAYNSINAKALGNLSDSAIGGMMDQAPSGQEPEIRPHIAFKVALEQILDGIDKAVNGFDYGGGDRNGRRRHFNGLVDNIDFYKGRIERLQQAGDMVVVVEGQQPKLTEAGQYQYDRIVEASEMIQKLKSVSSELEQAHHLVSPDEPYLPFAERMEKIAKEKEKNKKAGNTAADLLAKMGKELPKV